MIDLKKYNPTNRDKIRSRYQVIDNAEIFYHGRNLIIKALEDGIFPLTTKFPYVKQAKTEEEEKGKVDMKQFSKLIAKEETKSIDRTFFKDYFVYKSATEMLKDLVDNDGEKILIQLRFN